MRPSREGKKTGVHPEGDDALMFPLEMEAQTWRRTSSKNISPKEQKNSNGVGRSQPMDINKRTPIKNIPTRPVVKKNQSKRAPSQQEKTNNGYSDSSNSTPKKPSRPHHFTRLSIGDLEQLSDDDEYDIDPEAGEVPMPLPPPSPAELKEREEKIAFQRQRHLHEIEVPRSQSPPSEIQFLCAEMKQQKKQLTIPSNPSLFVKQLFEKQKMEVNTTVTTATTATTTNNDTSVTIVLPTVPEELNSPTKVIIKNALAIAVREAKEKKLQATVNNAPIPVKKDPKIHHYSDSDDDQWVDVPMKNNSKKKKKKKKKNVNKYIEEEMDSKEQETEKKFNELEIKTLGKKKK